MAVANAKQELIGATWMPKPYFLPVCPADGNTHCGPACEGARQFSWLNVFVSCSFSASYRCRGAISSTLRRHKLYPIFADKKHLKATLLPTAIYQDICKSAHAIVDFSNPESELPPTGVMTENGVIRCNTRNVLNLVDNQTLLPTDIRCYVYHRYEDMRVLGSLVAQWVEAEILWPLSLTRTLLFPNNSLPFKLIYHCLSPTAKPNRHPPLGEWDSSRLTGGGSGADILEKLIHAVADRPENFRTVCTTKQRHPPEDVMPIMAKTRLTGCNALLLDAPFSTTGKLNWYLDAVFAAARKSGILTRFDAAFDFLSARERKLYKGEEEKRLVYHKENFCANRQFDYGLVMRIPNPYDRKAFALIMAGLHSPASHAAARIMADPYEVTRLARKLNVSEGQLPDNLCFQAIFRVNRTFTPELLGRPKWEVVERIRL